MAINKEITELTASIDATRDRLASNLDQIVDRSQPEHIAQTQLTKVKNFYLDEHGGIRVERALKTAGVVLGLAVLKRLFK
jgi:cysteine sulfinate desulfinase/cysteine desulfurase-like protein